MSIARHPPRPAPPRPQAPRTWAAFTSSFRLLRCSFLSLRRFSSASSVRRSALKQRSIAACMRYRRLCAYLPGAVSVWRLNLIWQQLSVNVSHSRAPVAILMMTRSWYWSMARTADQHRPPPPPPPPVASSPPSPSSSPTHHAVHQTPGQTNRHPAPHRGGTEAGLISASARALLAALSALSTRTPARPSTRVSAAAA
eukprot:COSAG01_NODE_1999_length_8688_cov_6.237280_3_plen_198_part_00